MQYKPDDVRQYQETQYAGTRHTYKQEYAETARGSRRFYVQRPPGFVLRADMDVHGELSLSAPPRDIIIPKEFYPTRVDHLIPANATNPIGIISTSDLPQFPLTSATTAASYQPETATQSHSVSPALTKPLCDILCPTNSFARRSKIEPVGVVWRAAPGGAETTAAPHAEYEWRWRDTPLSSLTLNCAGTDVIIPAEHQDLVRVDGYAIHTLGVDITIPPLASGPPVFNTIQALIQISPTLLNTIDGTALDLGWTDGEGIQHSLDGVEFRVQRIEREADESGFAYFSLGGPVGPFPIPCVLERIIVETNVGEGVVLRNLVDDGINTAMTDYFSEWANERPDDANTIATFAQRLFTTSFQMPQVRFTPGRFTVSLE